MKKIFLLTFILVFIFVVISRIYASDWDKAGKALTVIEGIRLLTAGKVDIIGNISGIVREDRNNRFKESDHLNSGYYCRRPCCYVERVWVPHYVWKREYIPEHREYHQDYGEIIVEAHYIKYKVEDGGHWETKNYCH
ncbi:MAG: hypothetical protein NC820_06945 [Candidatus Omnitrophica bacterium]|nr:hypothetical protein [Candidatus Omnitrophota bacterium]